MLDLMTGLRRLAACVLMAGTMMAAPASAATEGASDLARAGDTGAMLRTILTDSAGEFTKTDAHAAELDRVVELYALRDFAPAWTGSDAAAERAAEVRALLAHAADQGLKPGDYALGWTRWSEPPAPGAEAARYEIYLSGALLRYATDLRGGRIAPSAAYGDAKLPAQDFDAAKALSHALANRTLDRFVADLAPPSDTYRNLVAALARYRDVAEKGGWRKLGAHPSGKALAARLALEDSDLAAAADPDGAEISGGLMRYEARNGLKLDEAPNADTIKALNIPVSFRIEQILANLERERWLPRKIEARSIQVNAADESVDYVRDGDVLLHSRVVVGKPNSPTPILRAEIAAVIVNPAWQIPDMIADEILPHLRRDANYLVARNIVLTDGPADDPHGRRVDWSKVRAGHVPYQLEQAPGPDNVLGALMLDMPNDFDVYLHDTPNKKLFDADMRESSHGCVRVEQIVPLASLVLDGDADKIQDAIASGETRRIALDTPLPVYLLYRTAIAQGDGTVGFRPDRYGRDARLAALLAAGGGKPDAKPALTAAR